MSFSVSSDNDDSSSSLDENTDSGVNIESVTVYEMAGPYLYESDALDLAPERGDQPDNCERERRTGLSRLDVKRLGEWRGLKTAFFIVIHPSSKLMSCV